MTTTQRPFLSPSSSLADREQARKVAVLVVMAVATSKSSYPEHSIAVANVLDLPKGKESG
jgi:hypothetical protein